MNGKILKKIDELNKKYVINDYKINLKIIYLKISFYENKLNSLYKNKPYKFQFNKYKKFNSELNEYHVILHNLYLKVEEELEKINNVY
ncbi:MAG: hypothetical protein IJ134_01405 [Bacilli bacterium]|nr:hypothetical protein [Bacilli bacterium]